MEDAASGANGAALVTGAGQRVGAAIARHLARHGWTVGVHYRRSAEPANKLVSSIVDAGGKAAAVQADLNDRTDIQSLVPKASDAIGPITCLVNNASTFEKDSMGDLEEQRWDAHFNVHTFAPVWLTDAMHQQLPDGANGIVINMIDQRVWRLNPLFTSYTLSKSALWTATQTMAQALAPKTRVCAIGPGPTLGSVHQDATDFESEVNAVPLKRGPSLDEVCNAVSFILNTPSLTGQMIALDGGQHLSWETPDVTFGG